MHKRRKRKVHYSIPLNVLGKQPIFMIVMIVGIVGIVGIVDE